MRTFDRTTERYFDLLEALRQAVIATDASGTIIHWSSAAKKLYGWKADEVLGKPVLEVTPADLSRKRGAEIMQHLAQGQAWSGQFNVRTRSGKSFAASVTDVPLAGVDGAVTGVLGVSAPLHTPTEIQPLLKRFASACKRVWPEQVVVRGKAPRKSLAAASEPHLIQLLSLLLLQYVDVLESGGVVEVNAATAEDSPFARFGLVNSDKPALYLSIDRRRDERTFSVLRSVSESVRPTQHVSALVRMVGGLLIAGTAPDRQSALHLFLPLKV